MALASFVLVPTTPANPPDVAFAGVCELSLDVTFTPALTLGVPASVTEVTVDGDGDCRMQDGDVYDGTLTGSARTLSAAKHLSCVGGTVTGTVDFYTDHPGFSDGIVHQPVVVSMAAGAVEMSVGSTTDQFAGAGAYLQDPDDTTACSTSGLAGTTWFGAFTFAVRGDLVVAAPPASGAP